MNPSPFVFVVGVPRSGTTLLQRMLNNHSQLAVTNDTHFIPRVLEKTDAASIQRAEMGKDIALEPAHVAATMNYHRFYRLGLTTEEVNRASRDTDTYAEFVSRLYRRVGEKHGKERAGEKTPDYVRRMPLLHGLFPQAKFVHIIRDGRDVGLSLRDWAHATKGPGKIDLWQQSPIAVSALWWCWFIENGRLASRRLSHETYFELQYEQLVNDPKTTVASLTNFLGLDFEQAMLEYHRGKSKAGSSLSAKSAWLSPKKGLRDWQVQMTGQEVELFEAIAGETLGELNYARRFDRFSNPVADTAEQYRTWWRNHFLVKHSSPSRTETIGTP